MTNIEYYKDEFVCMLKINKITLCSCFEVLNNHDDCDTCTYDVESFQKEGCCNYRKFIDWLLEEHKEPIKLKQWEKDLISLYDEDDEGYSIDYNFNSFLALIRLKEKGYFKGVTDTSMKIEDILENCEVIE